MTAQGYIDVPGARLYHEEAGSGRPLVLVHAGVANLRMWDPQLPRFAERHHVVRYDTRGWGRSEAQHVEFRDADDVAALLDHIGAERASVVGLSRGGSIALDFALAYPDRVDALVFAAGGIRGYEPEVDPADTAAFEEAERLWERKDWEALADFETRWWTDGPGQPADRVDPAIRERVHDWILTTYQAEKEEGLPQPLTPPANERLDQLRIPVLVIVGDLDDASTQEACRELARRVPDSRLEVFAGAAHMLNLEQPERFTELVLDFLDEAAARLS